MTTKKNWLIGIGSIIALAASIVLIKKARNTGYEKPPKKAPQLNIENPGSQDDFPKPPMESEIG